MTTPAQDCDACYPSVLSFLFLRASPIALSHELKPVGSDVVLSDPTVMAGLLPQRLPTESRFVLRLLRSGYVYIYIPKPPPGMGHWLVYRVTDEADLMPHTHLMFAEPNARITCKRAGHNDMGLKVLHLLQAHKIDEFWVAYSANLWNSALREQNKANPKTMQRVALAGGSPNTFAPRVDNLRSKVLECALTRLRIGEASDHDFPFNSIVHQVEGLAATLERAAAGHPRTKGLAQAIVLPDWVGMGAEFNAMRLRQNDLAQQYTLTPKVRQPMEVNKAIELFKGQIIADVDQRALEGISPIMSEGAFKAIMYVKPNPRGWPEGTRWEKLEVSHENTARYGWGAGKVIFPDQPQRARQWASAQAEATWSRMLKYYDEDQRQRWQAEFAAEMRQRYLAPLKRLEADWAGVLSDPAFLDYFALHFEQGADGSPRQAARSGCCAGAVYTCEAWLAYAPEPLTDAATAVFEAQLDAPITRPDAVMQRAVVGNHKSLIDILSDDKSDKTYDFIKGLIEETQHGATRGGRQPLPPALAKKLAWLSDATLCFALGLVSSMSAVAVYGVTVAVRGVAVATNQRKPAAGPGPLVDPKVLARLSQAQGMALIHRASEQALAAAMTGRAPNTPVYLVAHFDVDTALQIMRGRGQMQDLKTARQWAQKGRVAVGILSDAASVAQLKASPELLTRELAGRAGVVHLQEQAIGMKGQLVQSAAAGGMLLMPVDKFIDVVQAQRAARAAGPSLVAGWLQQVGKSVAGSSTLRIMRQGGLSIDGRLAIGAMIVQGLGAAKGLGEYEQAEAALDGDKQADAMLSIADGTAGFLGGFAELSGAMLEARLRMIAGQAGVDASVRLATLRGVAYGMGFAGNVINAVICFRQAGKLREQGNLELAQMMRTGGYWFSAGGVPLGLLALHSFAEAAVRRGWVIGTGKLAVEQIGKMLAGRLLLLSVPGWGWAFTAVGVGYTVYVALSTPTPIQQWLKGCYFGKPDKGVAKRTSWAEEEAALEQIAKDTMTPEEKRQRDEQAARKPPHAS